MKHQTAIQDLNNMDDPKNGIGSIVRSYDNPISLTELDKKRESLSQVIDPAVPSQPAKSRLLLQEDQRIVAYGGYRGSSGVLTECIVIAEDSESSEEAYRDVAAFWEHTASSLRTLDNPYLRHSQSLELEELDTSFSSKSSGEWSLVDGPSTTVYSKKPVGKLRVTTTTKISLAPGHDFQLFGIKQKVEMIPGSLVEGWGGQLVWQWGNDHLTMEQDYTKFSRGGPFEAIHEDRPESQFGTSGYSVSLGISGSVPEAGFSWTVSEPVAAIKNLSDTTTGALKWVVDIGTGSAEHSKLEHAPGSSARIAQPQGQEFILERRERAKFKRFRGPSIGGPSWDFEEIRGASTYSVTGPPAISNE